MKIELITQQNDFKIKLKDLEDELLFKLANAKGDILDDIALIENLEYSKKLSVEIAEKVAAAKITEAKINETSENYRPAASRGALFYFMLSDLSKIHSFYKYSLESFIVVINRAIDSISENKMYGKENMIAYGDAVHSANAGEDNAEGENQEEEQKPKKTPRVTESPKKQKTVAAAAAAVKEGGEAADAAAGEAVEGEQAEGENKAEGEGENAKGAEE